MHMSPHDEVQRRAELVKYLHQKAIGGNRNDRKRMLHPHVYQTRKSFTAMACSAVTGGAALALTLSLWPVKNDSLISWITVYASFIIGGILGIFASNMMLDRLYVEDRSLDQDYLDNL